MLLVLCSQELTKLNTETTKSVYNPFKSKVRELRTDCLETSALVLAVLHTNSQKAFSHLIFHRKALLSKEKVCMCTIHLRLVAVCGAECVPRLACISAALLKHLQIIIQRPTNRLLT